MENINVKRSTEYTYYNYSKVKQIFLLQFHFCNFIYNHFNKNPRKT